MVNDANIIVSHLNEVVDFALDNSWRRAKVITAEGEIRASRSLKDASDVISTSPAALQVRPVEFLKPLFISDLCAH
ncbi:STOM protein, partial [Acromyrmex insinuator]